MKSLADCAPLPAPPPVPGRPVTAQEPTPASRVFFDASRGRFVFERGPESLDVLVFPPRVPRCEEPRPERAGDAGQVSA